MISLWGLAVSSWLAAADAGAQAPRELLLDPGLLSKSRRDRDDVLLLPAGGGKLRWEGEGVRALISADGEVTFETPSGLRNNPLGLPIPLPLPTPNPPGTPTLEGSLRRLAGKHEAPPAPPDRDAPGRPDLPAGSQLVDICKAIGDLGCRYGSAGGGLTILASGPMDVTDFLPKFAKRDPKREQKARFLALTAPLRARMAALSRKEALDEGLLNLRGRLEAVWRDQSSPAPERRKTLFALWSESDASSDEGRRARVTIESFVRRHLPVGSKDAFTAAELSALQATPEGAAFRPYELAR